MGAALFYAGRLRTVLADDTMPFRVEMPACNSSRGCLSGGGQGDGGCRGARGLHGMNASVSIFENLAPTPAAYLQAARRVQVGEISGLRELRVAVLSTVSAQMLQPFLIVEGARRGLRLTPWF